MWEQIVRLFDWLFIVLIAFLNHWWMTEGEVKRQRLNLRWHSPRSPPRLQTNEDKNCTREMPESQQLPSSSPHHSNFNVESANYITTTDIRRAWFLKSQWLGPKKIMGLRFTFPGLEEIARISPIYKKKIICIPGSQHVLFCSEKSVTVLQSLDQKFEAFSVN